MLCVRPSPISGDFAAPPSKPLSQRYILAAALAEGSTEVGPLELSDDVVAALRAAQPISNISLVGQRAVIGRREPEPVRAFSVGDSGFTLRVATALYAGIKGTTVIYASEQVSRRPLEDLVAVLKRYAEVVWMPGVVLIKSGGVRRVDAAIRGDITSQYVSGLMYLSAVAEEGGRIRVEGRKSWQYVEATADVLRRFGGRVRIEGGEVVVEGPLKSPGSVEVPGDYALSAFLLVGAAVTGGRVSVGGLGEGPDKAILDVLKESGVSVSASGNVVSVEGAPTRPIDVDLSNAPDLAPPAALLAAFAPGRSALRGVEHLAYKESNRIETIRDVLGRMGISAEYKDGALFVEGPPRARDVEFKCHGDHRICLMALVAARAVGGCVDDISPVAKTWPSAPLYLIA
ncbi:MAG: 3-phosphoshikimate 1-carboxyvinyltransferase [Thermoproteus sp.]